MNTDAGLAATAAEDLPTPVEAQPGGDTPGGLSPPMVNHLKVPVTLLAVFGGLFVLHWASAVLVPLMLGLTFSYALGPAVNRLQRLHLPRAAAAGLGLAEGCKLPVSRHRRKGKCS